MKPLCPGRSTISKFDNFVYPMGYWTDLFYGEQFAKHNTNSVDHSLKLSKSFMISPYEEPSSTDRNFNIKQHFSSA